MVHKTPESLHAGDNSSGSGVSTAPFQFMRRVSGWLALGSAS